MGIIGHRRTLFTLYEFPEENKGTKSTFKAIIDENSPNLGKEADFQIPEAKRNPNRLNLSRAILTL